MMTEEKLLLSGKISAETLQYGKTLIKEGASVLEVTKRIEEKLLALGGQFAFPPQLSINATAAHYCAKYQDDLRFQAGDMVKLDLGTHVDGHVTDTALTVYLGDDEEMRNILEASKAALKAAIETVRPGVKTSEIGRNIEQEIRSFGFKPVRNLSGHGIGLYDIHSEPNIPNFDTGDNTRLHEGQLIAIEPFATNGIGMIMEKPEPEVFMQEARKSVRNPFTRQVLAQIESYKGLPFAKRWLVEKFDPLKVNVALKELLQLGVLHPFGPLVEKGNGMVSQHEHSMIVRDKPVVLTKS